MRIAKNDIPVRIDAPGAVGEKVRADLAQGRRLAAAPAQHEAEIAAARSPRPTVEDAGAAAGAGPGQRTGTGGPVPQPAGPPADEQHRGRIAGGRSKPDQHTRGDQRRQVLRDAAEEAPSEDDRDADQEYPPGAELFREPSRRRLAMRLRRPSS